MITKDAVDQGTMSLNDIIALMNQNYSISSSRGLVLSWKFINGLYCGQIKKGELVVFRQVYNERMLIRAIVYMHLDFQEFLYKKRTY